MATTGLLWDKPDNGEGIVGYHRATGKGTGKAYVMFAYDAEIAEGGK